MNGWHADSRRWKPSAKEQGRLWLGFGLVFLALALIEFLYAGEPSRSARWAWLRAPFFAAFGDNGDVVLLSIAAAGSLIRGLVLLHRSRKSGPG